MISKYNSKMPVFSQACCISYSFLWCGAVGHTAVPYCSSSSPVPTLTFTSWAGREELWALILRMAPALLSACLQPGSLRSWWFKDSRESSCTPSNSSFGTCPESLLCCLQQTYELVCIVNSCTSFYFSCVISYLPSKPKMARSTLCTFLYLT